MFEEQDSDSADDSIIELDQQFSQPVLLDSIPLQIDDQGLIGIPPAKFVKLSVPFGTNVLAG